jgi:ADP-ribose pyrophosphatase
MVEKTFEVLDRQVVFQGYFRIDKYRLRYRRYAGDWSNAVWREVFERGHAAAVLPYDPVRDEVVLIEQFRVGALDAPGGAWLLDIVAGIIEAGEDAEAVARRESVEEAGVTLKDLIPIHDYFASPGGTSERVALYCGRVDASRAGGYFGLQAEAEDIKAMAMAFDAAQAEMARRAMLPASLLIAMQWLALNREAVRRRWRS